MSDQNTTKLEIDSIIRNVKLIEKYQKEIENGEQKDMSRDQYALVFESFVLKYLPQVCVRKYFNQRTRFNDNKTFNKFLYGKYEDIVKLDNRIILRVCLGLMLTKQESYDFFYACGHNLFGKDEDCIERVILDVLEVSREKLKELTTEVEKASTAAKNIDDADEMYKERGLRGIYVNCEREEKEAKELYKEY